VHLEAFSVGRRPSFFSLSLSLIDQTP